MFQSLYDLEKICSARQLKMEKTILFFACNNLVLILTIFNNIVLQSFVLTFMCVPYYYSGPAEPEIANTGFPMFSFFSSNLPERNGIMVKQLVYFQTITTHQIQVFLPSPLKINASQNSRLPVEIGAPISLYNLYLCPPL